MRKRRPGHHQPEPLRAALLPLTAMPRARTHLARRLRRGMTEVEKRLWHALRETFPGLRFRRQHPIGPYVADFACPAAKVAIELDGGQHIEPAAADAIGAARLQQRGYRVIRLRNGDIVENLPGVLDRIGEELEVRRPRS